MNEADERIAALTLALRALVYEENTGGHDHDVPGVWDLSNGPPHGGTRCERCALFTHARQLLGGFE
jgi:hypothetical protein